MKKIISLVAVVALLLTAMCIPVSAISDVPERWVNESPAKSGAAYSFAIVGDTQILTSYDAGTGVPGETIPAGCTGQNYVYNLYNWIAQNKDTRKIKYVLGVGDLTQNESKYVNAEKEFINVMTPALKKLADANIPYSMARGNHDIESLFNAHIPTSYYKSYHTFRNDTDYCNAYSELEIGDTKYLFLTLELCASDAELTWASGVIEAHPNHKVIINTHAYMANGGNRWAHTQNNSYATATGNSGPQIWNKLVSLHENIFMVICGHIGTNTIEVTPAEGVNGNTVYQVMVNPQDIEHGTNATPLGTVALLNFYEDGSFGFEYYSTVKEKYNSEIYTYVPDTYVSTSDSVSARISETNPGMRFKTEIDTTYLNMLVNTYGAENVEVGTLIAPTDTLDGDLTHASGTVDVDYVDVKATVASPYATTATANVYLGSLVNIKPKNIDRDFTAVGYIQYTTTTSEGTVVKYIYSTTSGCNNVSAVAVAALGDTSPNCEGAYQYAVEGSSPVVYSKYTADERRILRSLLVTSYRDPYLEDIFG